jgi:hypothetical protein
MTLPISQTSIQIPESNTEQTRAARAFWDEYSGAAGLLDHRNGFEYRPTTGRYYRYGRPVTDKELRTYVQNVSTQAEQEARKTTQQLIAGVIIAAVWYDRMHNLMEALYRSIWIVSIGGFLFDDDTQRNAFYLFTLLQFIWLDNFNRQVRNGIQALNGMAMNRAALYGSYGNGLWQNAKLEQAIQSGKREAKNILGATEHHCHDTASHRGCIEIAKLGWIPIGQMPAIGSRSCYSNCLCHLIYR